MKKYTTIHLPFFMLIGLGLRRWVDRNERIQKLLVLIFNQTFKAKERDNIPNTVIQ